jgi:hypothetical protein
MLPASSRFGRFNGPSAGRSQQQETALCIASLYDAQREFTAHLPVVEDTPASPSAA